MDKIYDSLTESAKYALDDILNEYRDNLLGEAYMTSTNNDSGKKEISVKDIYYAKEIIERSNKDVLFRINKRKRLYSLFALSGIVYTMIGALIFFVQNSSFDLHKDLGPLLSLMGLFVTIFSYILYKFYDQNENYSNKELNIIRSYYVDDFMVVRLWTQIEQLGQKMMRLDNFEVDRTNVSSVIAYLNTILTEAGDRIKLKDILQTRNEIVHGVTEHSKAKIEEIIATENLFIEKLEKILAEKK